jgi:hypothetical protein
MAAMRFEPLIDRGQVMSHVHDGDLGPVISTEYGYPGAAPSPPRKKGAMSYARQLLDTYPRTFNVDPSMLATTINALTAL